MTVYQSTITAKGQTTVPVEIREFLSLKSGDRVRYIKREKEVVLKPKNRRAIEFAGLLRDPSRAAVSLEDIDGAIGDAIIAEQGGLE